jgi:hypothetical protein
MIPSDLRKEALELQKNVDWKDEGADGKFHFFFLIYYLLECFCLQKVFSVKWTMNINGPA